MYKIINYDIKFSQEKFVAMAEFHAPKTKMREGSVTCPKQSRLLSVTAIQSDFSKQIDFPRTERRPFRHAQEFH